MKKKRESLQKNYMLNQIKDKTIKGLGNNIKANQKGITLIALVVTIVVLLVLAGITISLVFSENGVINKAQEANENTQIAQVREQLELAKGPEYIEGNGKYNPDSYFKRTGSSGPRCQSTTRERRKGA